MLTMLYAVERTVPYSPFVVWAVLSDLTHFTRNDPYHHDFRWLGEKRRGMGTQFTVRHTYWPTFPFLPDTVEFDVEIWTEKRALKVFEKNQRPYRSHTQEFLLFEEEGRPDETTIQYEIHSMHIPAIPLLLLRWWAEFMVERRMHQKLAELEQDCERWQKEYDAHRAILHE